MKVRHLSIQRFRGIRELEWSVPGSMVCLIGPGDTTKSTILTAIEYALFPRWNLQILDTDFYMCDTEQPLQITVTVGELPDKLIMDGKFECCVRGWNINTGIRDEPRDEDELVLSIQLKVDETLEPSWKVVSDRDPEGQNIGSRDRENLGVNWLGSYVDREFTWGRGGALSRVTSQLTEDPDNISGVLADANRKAREAVSNARDKMTHLSEASRNTGIAATRFGVRPNTAYQPALDTLTSMAGASSLSLHEGDVPVRLAGQGSRRLLALALQRQSVQEGAILLVDEVEQALEPHRLRHLLRLLRPVDVAPGNPEDATGAIFRGQSLITTHSPIVVQELRADELFGVQTNDGVTKVQRVDVEALQGIVRRVPDAFLASKVIVCEGKTEFGVCRTLDLRWADETGQPFAYLGVVPVEGGGDEAPTTALKLAEFGNDVTLIVDSDKSKIQGDVEQCRQAGVEVIQWDGQCSIEERICYDLPAWLALQTLLEHVLKRFPQDSVIDALANRLSVSSRNIDMKEEWLSLGNNREPEVRKAIGGTAKDKGWFKRIDHGEWLGELVYKHLPEMHQTDLALKLQVLRGWIGYDLT